ncbi:MAG: DNA translocase FtsK 4TM domain-containing protein [Gammaproteobacteria bacterium]
MVKSAEQTTVLNNSLSRALREAALWVFGALALVLFAALMSYDMSDPTFSDTGSAGSVRNIIGPVGAIFAGGAFFFFGRPAFLFPLMLAAAGFMVFRARRNTEPVSPLELSFRIGGFILTVITSCGLATLHFKANGLEQTAGGVLGQLTGGAFAGALGLLGATLLLLALWLTGVSLFARLSWLAVMDMLGAAALNGFDAARAMFISARDRLAGRRVRQARQETVKTEKARVEARPAPRIEPVVAPPAPSERIERERQVPLFDPANSNELPPLNLLDDPPPPVMNHSAESLEARSRQVEIKLKEFGIEVEVVSVHPGPIVTRFELRPAPGLKASRVTGLSKDLARALSATSVRVVEVIPGKSVIGLEIPNEQRELVTLGEILRSDAYDKSSSPITLALGKDIAGHAVVADLAKMPHLMVAGTTGSGKSVAINAMVLSLLYKATADQVRLIMIDPKMLELSVYEGIPHLLAPVVTDMKEAANALRWCVAEMERRYRLMSAVGVRNLAGYNRKINEAIDAGEPMEDPVFASMPGNEGMEVPLLTPLPLIVVIIDELADMMMIVGKQVEQLIARLAQKARAAGLHLVVATQRPSVDVITGLIKANIPTRIAFQVSSRVDSRTILDQIGAEHLLGHGDMLYLPPGTSIPNRVHGAFVDDHEVHHVVDYLKSAGEPVYIEEILSGPRGPIPGLPGGGAEGSDAEGDELYDEAVRIVTETRKASISGVQRRLKIGYNRAARLVEAMEEAGVVTAQESNGSREVLAPPPPKD